MKNLILLLLIFAIVFFTNKEISIFYTFFIYGFVIFFDYLYFNFLSKELALLKKVFWIFNSRDANILWLGLNIIFLVFMYMIITNPHEMDFGWEVILGVLAIPIVAYILSKYTDKKD
jgi:hypothetical protein